jgi:hypothetical protein
MTLPGHDEIALVLQTALLGEVGPALRGVGFTVNDDTLVLSFQFDGPISDVDRESASCVETEVMAALRPSTRVSSAVIRADSPSPVKGVARWVYRRRE